MELNEKELMNIKGGTASLGTLSFIGGAIAFMIGVVSGYTNPTKCNN